MIRIKRRSDGSIIFPDKRYKWSLENFDDGYVGNGRFRVLLPDHPRANSAGYILRSIVAYEAYHRVEVPWGMIIHHIDGDTLNDSKENLEMMTASDHTSFHHKVRSG